ncbi:MAG TPA: hypothetical protein VNA20_10635 [Frankiaceae bacterium]|nr:hypothetical protein [Frankiaceae bacterium]
MSKSTVEVEEPSRRDTQRVGYREHDVQCRVALAVLDAGHVAARDTRSRGYVELADPGCFPKVANSTAEPDARVLSLVRGFSRHSPTLWPLRHPTSRRLYD